MWYPVCGGTTTADSTQHIKHTHHKPGFDPTLPSIWIVEGLLPYLPEAEVARLLKRMRALAPPGSFVGADHPATRLKDSAASAMILQRLEKLKAPLVRRGRGVVDVFWGVCGICGLQ